MSHIKHVSLFVSDFSATRITFAHKAAAGFMGAEKVTPMHTTEINGLHCFFVIPSGSKEGRDIGGRHEADIAKLAATLESMEVTTETLIHGELEG